MSEGKTGTATWRAPDIASGIRALERASLMSSSKCIDLWLRNVPRRTHSLTRYGRLATGSPFSTTSSACSGRGPAYVQQPDKTHPTVVESVHPAAVSQVALNQHSKAAERLRMPKSTKSKAEEIDDSTMEGKLKQMDELRAMQRIQQFDIWSQPMDLLGWCVIAPTPEPS